MRRTILELFAFIATCAFCLPIYAKSQYIDGGYRLGCISKDYLNKINEYRANEDQEASKKAILVGLGAGQCIVFNADEEVFLADTALLSGFIQVRRRGEMNEYWTSIEAIKYNSQEEIKTNQQREYRPLTVPYLVWVVLATLFVLVVGKFAFISASPHRQRERQEKREAKLAARIGVEKVGDEYRLKK